MTGEKKKGVVKWFNDRKGYGSIEKKNGAYVFAHYSEIIKDGFKTLPEGAQVEYVEIVHSSGALAALEIKEIKN